MTSVVVLCASMPSGRSLGARSSRRCPSRTRASPAHPLHRLQRQRIRPRSARIVVGLLTVPELQAMKTLVVAATSSFATVTMGNSRNFTGCRARDAAHHGISAGSRGSPTRILQSSRCRRSGEDGAPVLDQAPFPDQCACAQPRNRCCPGQQTLGEQRRLRRVTSQDHHGSWRWSIAAGCAALTSR